MLSSKFELLQNKYDSQIRKECDNSKYLLESCLKEHFEDHYVCKPYIEAFEKCIGEFTSKIKKNEN